MIKTFKKFIDKLKNDKLWMIIITILLILFICYFYFGFSFSNLFSKKESSDNQYNQLKIKENFENQNTVQYPKNLITNGSFENGTKPDNYVSQSGSNKIINYSNPSFSPYVLQQTQTNDLTYYELQSYCEDNTKYLFLIWTSFRNNDSNSAVDNIDLSKIVQVRVLKKDGTNDIPSLNYKIVEKVNLQDNVDTWYLVSYNWTTSGDTDNLMNVYLNYSNTLQSTYQYFTGLRLYKVLPEAENFIYNDKLNLYLDGYHASSSSKVWNDNSTYGNDLNWSMNPVVDSDNGFVNTNNNKLTGRTSTQLFGEGDSSFTFIFMLSKTSDSSSSSSNSTSDSSSSLLSEEEDYVDNSNDNQNTNKKVLLLVPGNNTYSLKLSLNVLKNKFIIDLPNSKSVQTKEDLVLNNETMITVIYTTGGNIQLYQDNNNLINSSCDKFYYSNTDQIQINPNKDLDINLYALLNYQRVVSTNELQLIRNYFIQNKNKDFSKVTINRDYDNSNYYKSDWSTISAYNKRDPTQSSTNDGAFYYQYGNQTLMYQTNPKNCLPACNTLCQAFIDDIDKYHDCMRNCKNVIPSCKNYCNDDKNKNSLLCEVEKCENPNEFNPDKDCPIGYKRLGEYMVNIKPDTYYAKMYHYSGEKSYGKDLDNARTMYMMNFPKCKLPENFHPGDGKSTIEKCPYVIYEGNPCYQSVCAGVNWDESNYKNLKMSDKCKKSVSYYCQVNCDLDDMCKCWREEYKDNQKCIEYRKFFENPLDYCPASAFNIEDHPSIDKYIKKDKIPCYGCKVD